MNPQDVKQKGYLWKIESKSKNPNLRDTKKLKYGNSLGELSTKKNRKLETKKLFQVAKVNNYLENDNSKVSEFSIDFPDLGEQKDPFKFSKQNKKLHSALKVFEYKIRRKFISKEAKNKILKMQNTYRQKVFNKHKKSLSTLNKWEGSVEKLN